LRVLENKVLRRIFGPKKKRKKGGKKSNPGVLKLLGRQAILKVVM
jgi:hypothetical protein